MINGAHVILFSRDPEADRQFLRDVLGFAGVDAGEGWLILALPPAEIAVHPGDDEPRHELYLMCDDVRSTFDALATRGVEIASDPRELSWGVLGSIRLPSGAELGIYEPRHPRPTKPSQP